MNGYNWGAFLNYYLAENAPDILQSIDSDPEAGTYAAYFAENEEEIYKILQEKRDKIEWD